MLGRTVGVVRYRNFALACVLVCWSVGASSVSCGAGLKKTVPPVIFSLQNQNKVLSYYAHGEQHTRRS